jgi:hypothetical protein
VRESRSLAVTCRYRCWLLIHRPVWKEAWASQLPPPNVDEVRKPLRAVYPAAASFRSPSRSTGSTTAAISGFSRAVRP